MHSKNAIVEEVGGVDYSRIGGEGGDFELGEGDGGSSSLVDEDNWFGVAIEETVGAEGGANRDGCGGYEGGNTGVDFVVGVVHEEGAASVDAGSEDLSRADYYLLAGDRWRGTGVVEFANGEKVENFIGCDDVWLIVSEYNLKAGCIGGEIERVIHVVKFCLCSSGEVG